MTALHDSRAGDAVYAVDPDGRLLTEQLPGRLARRYRYDHGLLSRFTVIRDGSVVNRAAFTHDPDGRVATQREDGELIRYRYDAAGQLTGILREELGRREPDRRRLPDAETAARPGFRDLHLTYDVLGNRTSLRGEVETHYRYDAASQLLGSDREGRHTEYRYDPAGRLTEEHRGRAAPHDRLQRVRPARLGHASPAGRTDRAEAVFNGNALLASLNLTSENR